MASLKIESSTALTLQLEDWGPIASAEEPGMGTRGREIWRSPDEKIGTGVWECDAGTFRANFAQRGEFIHIVNGTMTCTADDGTVTELGPGDAMTFPQGWSGTWHVHTALRKVYCDFKQD